MRFKVHSVGRSGGGGSFTIGLETSKVLFIMPVWLTTEVFQFTLDAGFLCFRNLTRAVTASTAIRNNPNGFKARAKGLRNGFEIDGITMKTRIQSATAKDAENIQFSVKTKSMRDFYLGRLAI